MKKTLLLTVLGVLLAGSLCGCQEKPPNEEQIGQDFPSELTNLSVDTEIYDLELVNLEIEKRQTNEKDDTVYFTYEMSTGAYTVTGGYYFCYVYYDEGGWVLENYSEYGDTEIIYEGDVPSVQLDLAATGWEVEQSLEPHRYDNVTQTDVQKNSPTSFTYFYHAEKEDPYRSKSGPVALTYTLQKDFGLNAHWEQEVDESGVSETWNVVGKYQGKAKDDSNHLSELVIDSYDPNTGIAHIAYAKVEDISNIHRLYDYNFEMTDLQVELEPFDNHFSGTYGIKGKVSIDTSSAFTIRSDSATLTFTPNSASFDGTALKRVS